MNAKATKLAPLEVASRLDKLRTRFDEAHLDALIVTNLANVRYLSGFSGSAGVVVITAKGTLLTTDGRYRTQSAEQLAAAKVDGLVSITIGDAQSQRDAVRALISGPSARIGLEADNVTWSSQRRWAELLEEAGSLVPTTGGPGVAPSDKRAAVGSQSAAVVAVLLSPKRPGKV